MGKLTWYANRLRAMNVREIVWRLRQKHIAFEERAKFGNTCICVDENVWNKNLTGLRFDRSALGINFKNNSYSTSTDIRLLQGPDNNRWPDTFSYALDYKQKDELGDARTCWEKHRHFQYALLAKKYFVTGDISLLSCLDKEETSWCRDNPFLHGIAWTSVMEIAIRAINWMLAMAFLGNNELSARMSVGAINMADYVSRHYSRYSSANNHLLVEASAIGMAGYAFGNHSWKELAVKILSEELANQNYEDGVNKELSLHYQTFGMEAYCLLAHVMRNNGDSVPQSWTDMLQKQAGYVANSVWNEQVAMEFGDDDEGKIIDLHGGNWQYINYVLQFSSLITGKRFHSFNRVEENICWLFSNADIERIKTFPLFDNKKSCCYKIGGNTFLRDASGRILIGIDHAALGFGSIAAHGHADALSVQMMVDGNVVLADPGTYIYHCCLPMRNAFRKTINHNTICLKDKNGACIDQSQMLGAFLWGKRANCVLENWQTDQDHDTLTASHDGYSPIIHQRTIDFMYKSSDSPILRIKDYISGDTSWVSTWILGGDCTVDKNGEGFEIICGGNKITMCINTDIDNIQIENAEISEAYGSKRQTKAIRIYGENKVLSVDFKINLKNRK